MSASPSTIYLVTGANRGIGLALVTRIVEAHPDAFIYAGVRDPAQAPAVEALSVAHPGRIAIVKCVSGDADGNAALAAQIKAAHGRVDTVIANAGMSNSMTGVLETSPRAFEEHFATNVLGPAVLFQALHDLLRASAAPRFVPITSIAASIGGPSMAIPGLVAYSASKAALNYITRKIHFEHAWLIAFPLAPGPVSTDMWTPADPGVFAGADAMAQVPDASVASELMEKYPPLTPAQAAAALLGVIDGATREKDGGEFVNVDGTRLPW